MCITKGYIESFLKDMKKLVSIDQYRIMRGKRRQDNIDLFFDYVMDENCAKSILLSLTPEDFSKVLQNEHIGYEHELLYVFGKEVTLMKRFDSSEDTISLYIKLNRLENNFVIVVSFHIQKYPMEYMFK